MSPVMQKHDRAHRAWLVLFSMGLVHCSGATAAPSSTNSTTASGGETNPVRDAGSTATASLTVPAQGESAATTASEAPAVAFPSRIPGMNCRYTSFAAPGKAEEAGLRPSIGIIGQVPGGPEVATNTCHTQACLVGVSVRIPSIPSFTPGNYKIEIETSAGRTTCEAAFPIVIPVTSVPSYCPPVPTQHKKGMRAPCPQGPTVYDNFGDGMYFSGPPQHVKIKISRENNVVVARESTPTYTNLRHDGYECPKVCQAGTDNGR